jgi:hypothetical protein
MSLELWTGAGGVSVAMRTWRLEPSAEARERDAAADDHDRGPCNSGEVKRPRVERFNSYGVANEWAGLTALIDGYGVRTKFEFLLASGDGTAVVRVLATTDDNPIRVELEASGLRPGVYRCWLVAVNVAGPSEDLSLAFFTPSRIGGAVAVRRNPQ